MGLSTSKPQSLDVRVEERQEMIIHWPSSCILSYLSLHTLLGLGSTRTVSQSKGPRFIATNSVVPSSLYCISFALLHFCFVLLGLREKKLRNERRNQSRPTGTQKREVVSRSRNFGERSPFICNPRLILFQLALILTA